MSKFKDSFFLVWNLEKLNPTRKHTTAVHASTEARRLASKHPGEIFYIVNAVGLAYVAPKATSTKISHANGTRS